MRTRFVVPVLLAVAFVNPALLAQVTQPADSSRAAQAVARRAFRRSRRIWLAHADRTQVNRQSVVAKDGTGTDDTSLTAVVFAAFVPVLVEARTRESASAAITCSSVPRYLLYCTLLI